MRAAKVQASLRIRAVSPEPSLLAHTSSESRGTFRQKARSLAPLNGWACAVKICHDGMLEDTNSLDGAQVMHPKNADRMANSVHPDQTVSSGSTLFDWTYLSKNLGLLWYTNGRGLLNHTQYTRCHFVIYYTINLNILSKEKEDSMHAKSIPSPCRSSVIPTQKTQKVSVTTNIHTIGLSI